MCDFCSFDPQHNFAERKSPWSVWFQQWTSTYDKLHLTDKCFNSYSILDAFTAPLCDSKTDARNQIKVSNVRVHLEQLGQIVSDGTFLNISHTCVIFGTANQVKCYFPHFPWKITVRIYLVKVKIRYGSSTSWLLTGTKYAH